MTIEEAIKKLRASNTPEGNLVLREYQVLYLQLEILGKRVAQEMTEAADWQAVSMRLKALLENRNKPGMDEAITAALAKLNQPATQNEQQNTDRPQG